MSWRIRPEEVLIEVGKPFDSKLGLQKFQEVIFLFSLEIMQSIGCISKQKELDLIISLRLSDFEAIGVQLRRAVRYFLLRRSPRLGCTKGVGLL